VPDRFGTPQAKWRYRGDPTFLADRSTHGDLDRQIVSSTPAPI
jgi:hypothetical protein